MSHYRHSSDFKANIYIIHEAVLGHHLLSSGRRDEHSPHACAVD